MEAQSGIQQLYKTCDPTIRVINISIFMNKFYLSCQECPCSFLLGLIKIKCIIHSWNISTLLCCRLSNLISSLKLSILFLPSILWFFISMSILRYCSLEDLRIVATVLPSIFVYWLLVKLRSYVFVSSISWVVPIGIKA